MRVTIAALLLLTVTAVHAQSISLDSVTTPTRCDTASVTVYYTATGFTDAKNVFTVQLSTAAGSFGSFSNAGSLKSTASESIPISVPTGDHYRVRVAASTPYLVSADNGSDIAVAKSPKADFWVNDSIRSWPQQNIKGVGDTLVFHANRWWAQSLTYSWDFGSDATPSTSTDPVVPVVFRMPGSKSVTLRASTGECEAVNVASSAAIIEACSATIPSDAIIDSTTMTTSDLNYYKDNQSIWVVPGGTLDITDARHNMVTKVFVEPGGTVSAGYTNALIYLKAGAVYAKNEMNNNIIVYEPGASYPEMLWADGLVTCDNLIFDYSDAPPYTISWLGVTPQQYVRPLRITPSPAVTVVTIDAPEVPQSLIVRDIRGAEIFRYDRQILTTTVLLDVSSFAAGTYFVGVQSASGSSIGKFSIQK